MLLCFVCSFLSCLALAVFVFCSLQFLLKCNIVWFACDLFSFDADMDDMDDDEPGDDIENIEVCATLNH